jgi:hypothetical protein
MKKKLPSAIGIMRWEIAKRDGKDCLPCVLLGYCDPKGKGWCQGIQMVSADLNDATYRKLEALRGDNASLHMHLSHMCGKDNEKWGTLCNSCPCHNDKVSTEIRDVVLPYLATIEGTETKAFKDALDRRPAEKAAIKESRAGIAKASYQWKKKKVGGTPLSKMKGKKPPKKEKPHPGGRKYASTKWAAFDALPRFNQNL